MQTFKRQTQRFVDNTLENVEKNLQNQAKTTIQSATSQFTGQTKNDLGTNEAGAHQNQQANSSQDATREVIEDFYAPSNPKAAQSLENLSLPKAGEMTPEEQVKYQKLRKLLHDEVYYNRLVERKSTEQEHAEEAHQEQQEQQMEALQIEEKKKQDDDIALRMQTHKAEQFPGVAG